MSGPRESAVWGQEWALIPASHNTLMMLCAPMKLCTAYSICRDTASFPLEGKFLEARVAGAWVVLGWRD